MSKTLARKASDAEIEKTILVDRWGRDEEAIVR